MNSYILKLPKTITNIEHGKQLVRSGSSVGANYIEANESLSKKDFILRVKISKKEAKESRYWLYLTEPLGSESSERDALVQETNELMKIFGAILGKTK
ncbi:MAG: four helix bundle protein [Patescibacteria group bacterium]|nr:four helix bundle protein [Patescibacteria group bacterium]